MQNGHGGGLQPTDLVLSSGAIGNPESSLLVEAAVAGGYAGLTLWPGDYHPRHRPGSDLRVLRQRCEDADLVLHDLDAMVVWVGADDPGGPYFEEAPETDVFEMAEILGVDGINLLFHADPSLSIETEARLDLATEAFAAACDRAADYGVRLHLEFSRRLAPAGIPDAARVVRAANRTNGGLMIDAWHVHWGPSDLTDLTDLPGTLVTGVQLCDAPAAEPEDYGFATRHQRALPGEGVVDLEGMLRTLRGIGSPAPLSLEVFDTARCERIGPVAWAQEMAAQTRRLLTGIDANA